MKLDIAFLFGAGCECRNQFNIPSGADFHRDTLVAKDVKKLIESINESKEHNINNGLIIAYNSTSVLYQSLVECEIDNFDLSIDEKCIAQKYIELKQTNSSSNAKEITKDFAELYRKFYNEIKSPNTNKISKGTQYFLEHGCFFSYVDSLFNCLRKPKQYQNETNRIIKLYYSAYKSIIESLIASESVSEEMRSQYKEMLESKSSIMKNRKILLNIVKDSQQSIVKAQEHKDNLYYNIIRKFLHTNDNIKAGIITTNYTLFADNLLKIKEKHVAHVHGVLTEFEELNTKQVDKLDLFSESDYVFPSIFIQSGVKPIVSAKQICEMYKAVSMIDSAKHMVILGYGINSDDEHIINFIRMRLKAGKKVHYFIYYTSEDEYNSEQNRVKRILLDVDNLKLYKYKDFEAVLNRDLL